MKILIEFDNSDLYDSNSESFNNQCGVLQQWIIKKIRNRYKSAHEINVLLNACWNDYFDYSEYASLLEIFEQEQINTWYGINSDNLREEQIKVIDSLIRNQAILSINPTVLITFEKTNSVLSTIKGFSPRVGNNTQINVQLSGVLESFSGGYDDQLIYNNYLGSRGRKLSDSSYDIGVSESLISNDNIVFSENTGLSEILQNIYSTIDALGFSVNINDSEKKLSNFDIKSHPIVKPNLAYVSPLPPEKTGIAIYSDFIIDYLSLYYKISLVTDQSFISENPRYKFYPVFTYREFEKNMDDFDRVIYHIGNSPYHAQMWNMLKIKPGVVVLHDFYLGHAQLYRQDNGVEPNALLRNIYIDGGYQALVRYQNSTEDDSIWRYPCNSDICHNAKMLIYHSKHTMDISRKWNCKEDHAKARFIPLPRLSSTNSKLKKIKAKQKLGFKDSDFIICSFGVVGPTKLTHSIISAWVALPSSIKKNSKLAIVGGYNNEYGDSLKSIAAEDINSNKVIFTGWVDDDVYEQYLSCADLAIQLRTQSRGEGSLTVLDCFAHQLPVISNKSGGMEDFPSDIMLILDNSDIDTKLVSAIHKLYDSPSERQRLSDTSYKYLIDIHDPMHVAKQYVSVVEESACVENLFSALDVIKKLPFEFNLQEIAIEYAKTFAIPVFDKQILIDVSALAIFDLKTGIQRQVRNTLNNLFLNCPSGYRIEPVYCTAESNGFIYARDFTNNFLGISQSLVDSPVEVRKGDIFLGLDLNVFAINKQVKSLDYFFTKGVAIYFLIYDILPASNPEWFPASEFEPFSNWLKVISKYSGVVCISEATKVSYKRWLNDNSVFTSKKFRYLVNHCGADIDTRILSNSLTENDQLILNSVKNSLSFIMVGTIEPRKGHADILDAFETLWVDCPEITLVIIGKPGWMCDDVIDLIRNHVQFNQRLFWLNGISDDLLEKLYNNAKCLIAASYDEGFGLPLIEAASHNIPLFVRDISVFREVGGENVEYFKSKSPDGIAVEIKQWIKKYKNNSHVKSMGLKYSTWEQSTLKLLSSIVSLEV